ncbi:coenzyme F420-0:L-glutamate ligase [Microbacterium sp. KSW2-29]|uniref:Coenzyme F420-0:L-glutamate ligase n=1 Tax=Microbacterium phycohabitans TaxID=3075993 RepID=A0ABU3SL30_9MICO|nr:coenzyme F420-0:L-glutamate ligase [Microbacterium sp. KSW2-29]MDU0345090.1 coenzyme F420-0:L-glutamate ligase [Microbacterium sp. KSW2-29]
MLQIWALDGIREITPGDDLVGVILDALPEPLADGDIVVVTSKIVSKAEGRIIEAADREDAITRETVRLVASRTSPTGHVTRIVENPLGIVSAAAGVDASNTPEGTVLLLPVDPDASARALATGLRTATGAHVGVIITDTLGRAWREGQTDHAIGAGGIHVFEDLRGTVDAEGRPLVVTLPCVADEIAAATDLVKGKASRRPVAVVRGRGDLVGDLDLPGARSIVRDPARDMFRQGADEAYAEGFAAGRAAGA